MIIKHKTLIVNIIMLLLILILGVLVTQVYYNIRILKGYYPVENYNSYTDNVDSVLNKLSHEKVITIDTEADRLVIEPIANQSKYVVSSINVTYPIGVYNTEDTKSIVKWIISTDIPPTDSVLFNLQHVYQSIVEEKIWE